MILVGMIIFALIIYLIYSENSNKCTCETENARAKCYNCGHLIKDDFVYCPKCKVALKEKCEGCNKLINIAWRSCPYCNTKRADL